MKLLLKLLLITLATVAIADEWGSWDDLPDDLLSSSATGASAVDKLYDQLAAEQGSIDAKQVEQWVAGLNLEFSDNEELTELLSQLEGSSDAEIQAALDEWLEDQLDELDDDIDDDLDDLDDDDDDDDDLDEPEDDDTDDSDLEL